MLDLESIKARLAAASALGCERCGCRASKEIERPISGGWEPICDSCAGDVMDDFRDVYDHEMGLFVPPEPVFRDLIDGDIAALVAEVERLRDRIEHAERERDEARARLADLAIETERLRAFDSDDQSWARSSTARELWDAINAYAAAGPSVYGNTRRMDAVTRVEEVVRSIRKAAMRDRDSARAERDARPDISCEDAARVVVYPGGRGIVFHGDDDGHDAFARIECALRAHAERSGR